MITRALKNIAFSPAATGPAGSSSPGSEHPASRSGAADAAHLVAFVLFRSHLRGINNPPASLRSKPGDTGGQSISQTSSRAGKVGTVQVFVG
jgi:hypothetical protein